jgi:hypothetical protein
VESLAECGRVYRKAAQAVYPEVLQHPSEAHPLAFLYRHSIEVYLKAILYEGGSELAISRAEVRERGHDLCKQVPDVVRVSQRFNVEFTRRTQNAITQIQGVDPGGDRFRYDVRGNDLVEFDVKHLFQECERVLEELSKIYDQIYEQVSSETIKTIEAEEGITEDSN